MKALSGKPLPLGSSKNERGYNFALFSKHAQKVHFYLFKPKEQTPLFEMELDPQKNKTGNVWHIQLDQIPEKAEYGFILDGPNDPKSGVQYDSSQMVADPYAKTLNFPNTWGAERPYQLHGGVIDDTPFDWQEDRPPNLHPKDLIIYEMHVRGFTKHDSSQVKQPGTYLGMIEKIPHLKQLGVTAVELLPIFEFNECEYTLSHPKATTRLYNYWGYSTVNFFSPMKRYASSEEWNAEIDEFKTLVRELHKNGIEVILDVVYNHTSEQKKNSGLNSFGFIDNSTYYMLDKDGKYKNYSGCGNTFNCNNPVVSELILNSLRYWVIEMHVDGFRFDLASILTRDPTGKPQHDPFVIAAITGDPVLSQVKLIAEAWDAAGLYQVGQFPYSERWADWNGRYRDTVRNFIKGTDNTADSFVKAITGSEYLYGETGSPYYGINFVTAHDGFSLHDLVTYQEKHNEANGEDNRDGANDNYAWNCGIEGETTDPHILQLRHQQKCNFHVALMMSLGIPMILMGDEYCRTAKGNNNTWCQDNELNWFLWDELQKEENGFFRFYRLMINFRKECRRFFPEGFYKPEDIQWHGSQSPLHPDWGLSSRFVALTLLDREKGENIYLAFNAFHHEIDIRLPHAPEGKKWYRIVDSSLPSPNDFAENPKLDPPLTQLYKMKSHTCLLLQAL